MDQGIWIAAVGLLGTVAGVVGTLLATQLRLRMEWQTHSRDQLISYYQSELAHSRNECARWQELALKNLSGMEVAREVIETQRTEAPT